MSPLIKTSVWSVELLVCLLLYWQKQFVGLKLAQKESVSTISTFLVQLRYYYSFNYTQFWTQTGGDPTDM